jgi:hypothetical protein
MTNQPLRGADRIRTERAALVAELKPRILADIRDALAAEARDMASTVAEMKDRSTSYRHVSIELDMGAAELDAAEIEGSDAYKLLVEAAREAKASVAVNATRMDISEQPDQLAGLNMTEPVEHVLVDKLCIIIGNERKWRRARLPPCTCRLIIDTLESGAVAKQKSAGTRLSAAFKLTRSTLPLAPLAVSASHRGAMPVCAHQRVSFARARGGWRASPRRFCGRTYMTNASGCAVFALSAAMSASSAPTTT